MDTAEGNEPLGPDSEAAIPDELPDEPAVESERHAEPVSVVEVPQELSHAVVRPDETESQPLPPHVFPTLPGLRGTLEQAPLPQQLIWMHNRCRTGSLILSSNEGDSVIYFHHGFPAKVRTAECIAPLDETLIGMSLLNEQALVETYELACDMKMLHGAALVRLGLIDQETLDEALRRQLVNKVTSLFSLPHETHFEYLPHANVLDSYGGKELIVCEPLSVVTAGLRRNRWNTSLEQLMWRLDGLVLTLAPGATWIAFDLEQEQRIIDLLRREPRTVRELLSCSDVDEQIARRTLYTLALSGYLHYIPDASDQAFDWDDEDDIPTSVRYVEPIADTPFAETSQQTPTPSSRPSLSDGPRVEVPALRRARITTDPTGLSKMLAAVRAVEYAKQLIATDELAQAELHLREAVSLDPTGPEGLTLLAWVQAIRLPSGNGPNNQGNNTYRFQLRMLDRVLSARPDYVNAHFYRGLILQRTDRGEEAEAAFRQVLKLQPNHLGAARELRLQALRSKKTVSGLFRRWRRKP